jgi:hypothetical protein
VSELKRAIGITILAKLDSLILAPYGREFNPAKFGKAKSYYTCIYSNSK